MRSITLINRCSATLFAVALTMAAAAAPVGRMFMVRMDKITGAKVKAWWFNPRTGTAEGIGEFPRYR